jgi:hypothetical protein
VKNPGKALYSDAAKTAAMLGHRANDQVLFDSYRSLAPRKDAEQYFGIVCQLRDFSVPQVAMA